MEIVVGNVGFNAGGVLVFCWKRRITGVAQVVDIGQVGLVIMRHGLNAGFLLDSIRGLLLLLGMMREFLFVCFLILLILLLLFVLFLALAHIASFLVVSLLFFVVLADNGARKARWLVIVCQPVKLAHDARLLILGGLGFRGGSLSFLLRLKLTCFLDLLLLSSPILEPVL